MELSKNLECIGTFSLCIIPEERNQYDKLYKWKTGCLDQNGCFNLKNAKINSVIITTMDKKYIK